MIGQLGEGNGDSAQDFIAAGSVKNCSILLRAHDVVQRALALDGRAVGRRKEIAARGRIMRFEGPPCEGALDVSSRLSSPCFHQGKIWPFVATRLGVIIKRDSVEKL